MPSIPRRRAAGFCCVLFSLLGAVSANAATTLLPNRFDDPLAGGTTCAPPAPANACSLRGAVAAAQTGDTVQLGAGVYTLSQGQLSLTKAITLGGAGPALTTIRQTAPDRVISFVGVDLTMHGVTVTGGHMIGINGPGGASVGADGQPGGSAYGGGLNGNGALTLTDVVITGNTVTGGTGGAGHSGAGTGGKGGAGGTALGAGISGGSPMTLTRVAVTGNVAHAGAAGNGGPAGTAGVGGVGGGGGSAYGAGIDLGLSTVLVARDTVILGNQAIPTAAGTGGTGGTTSGAGGAGGQAGNAAGGGLFSNGIVKFTNVTLSGNSALGSSGGTGGAAKSASIATAGGAGGVGWGGTGGGAALWNAPAAQAPDQFASVTVAGNSVTDAAAGAGGAGAHSGPTGATAIVVDSRGGGLSVQTTKLTMRDSIVALSAGHSGSENCSIVSAGSLTSAGHNLEDRNQCIAVPAAGDLHDASAGLGPLQDNGGPTKTMALLPGSAAIGAAGASCLDALGATLTADQRGLPRGAACDIGAFDGQAPTVTASPSVAGTATATRTITCSAGAFGGDLPQTSAVQWLRDGAPLAGATATSYAVVSADVGHALSCRQSVTNAFGAAAATSGAVTAAALPPPSPPPPGPAVLALKGLQLSPKKVRNGHRTTISFTLTGAAGRVTFSIRRKAGKRLKKVSGAPKAVSAKLGTTKVTWNPRGLKRGSYRLTATPAGGRAVTIAFAVRRQ
ncbi:MAG: Hemolysin-type calcium-binding region [Solirubrobacterales bacterium]|nr:Hemolysin-type calcium-binding region [Solirubrobacterales bacterium]